MPATKRPKPLYQRGDFKLYPRAGRNHEIVWYDPERGRERTASAGTSDDGEGRKALDKLYLKSTGQRFCETCGRPFDGESSPLLLRAINDYLIEAEPEAGYKSTSGRLAHVIEYLAATDPAVTCAQIDQKWVVGFRKWVAAKPVLSTKGKVLRDRSVSHVEQCVLQLAAAINATPGQSAQFTNEQLRTVAMTPHNRASVPMIAAMFRFCLEPSGPHIRSDKERDTYRAYRANLLRYLRAAVATWARPEEIFDISKPQWVAAAGVLDLNPPRRRQTRKYRGRIAIPRQFAPYLDAMDEQYMPVSSVRSTWGSMRKEIGLPKSRGESGEKLIRRSMATLARKRIGEANWLR
jgi:hypothetical protein